MKNHEFKIAARRFEKAFGEQVLPRPSSEFIEEQERRESVATLSFFMQVSHGIGMVMIHAMFLAVSLYSYKTLDPEGISTASLAFGSICLFYAYLISPLNQSSLKPSEIPMDSYVFRSICGRPKL